MTVKAETSREFPITMTLTRRGFVKIGGALLSRSTCQDKFRYACRKKRDFARPDQLASWLEIRDDNTILDGARAGRRPEPE